VSPTSLITDITNPFDASLHKSIEAVFRKRGLTSANRYAGNTVVVTALPPRR
jgi:hypothetical protein